MDILFKAELWEYQGEGAWCFITVPADYYEVIKEIATPLKKGFGSVKVEAIIGNSKWKTSIFPDSKTKSYLLPVKKAVRKAENFTVGDTKQVSIKIIEI